MGKVKWNTKAAEIDEVEEREGEEFEPYDGPIPPKNSILRVKLKWARVVAFGTGSGGLKMLLEVAEPKSSPKAKFNGLPFFENLVDVDTQAWKIKQFMTSIGGTGRHWGATVTVKDDKDNEVVQKFGNILTDGLYIRVRTDRDTYQDELKATVGRYLPKRDEEEAAEDAAESGDDDSDNEPPF